MVLNQLDQYNNVWNKAGGNIEIKSQNDFVLVFGMVK